MIFNCPSSFSRSPYLFSEMLVPVTTFPHCSNGRTRVRIPVSPDCRHVLSHNPDHSRSSFPPRPAFNRSRRVERTFKFAGILTAQFARLRSTVRHRTPLPDRTAKLVFTAAIGRPFGLAIILFLNCLIRKLQSTYNRWPAIQRSERDTVCV